jgi:hypothetical protein
MTKKAALVLSKLRGHPNKILGLKFLRASKKALPGAVAGAVATTAVMPLDTISDVQKQWRNDPKASPRIKEISRSFTGTAKELNKQEGPSAFYAGYGGKLLKVVPSTAITFATAGAIMKKLKIKHV